MAIIRFFKLPKPKQFEHIPIYYDSKKEENELGENKNSRTFEDSYETANKSKGSYRQQRKKTSMDAAKSNIRILIVIIVLQVLAFYFLFS
ncbi:MAG: hypothetical protein A2X08_17185 [Bacteroidetes bacterium GWA2_32_17]|nr:MAG: hypothetical protein A2X08_17185 [Bacteroidetes bacterium GWA2_32_17]